MKILIINNFNDKHISGGVENYLLEFTAFAKKHNTDFEFYWFGKDSKKTNWIQKFYNYTTTNEIKKIIDDFKPDVIHCFSIGAPISPHFMKYAKKKRIPILYSFRDYYYICPKNYMLTSKGEIISIHKSGLSCIFNHYPKKNLLYDTLIYLKQSYHKKYISKYVTYFLTPSDNLTKTIQNHFKLNGETLSNPTMLENTEGINSSEDYLLYVGRLDKEKGVMTLLKAFRTISLKHPTEKLLIVGEGNQMEELITFKNTNKLDNIIFIGKQNREELKAIYSKAKFIVVPSEILESYGNVVLESFAFGKTIIASDLIGIKKEIFENNCGLIFPFGNIERLTESIELLLTNASLKNELATNGLAFAKTRSFKNHFDKQLEIYTKLLEKTTV